MLVLTRKKNQVIQIGDNFRLHVVGISRSSVKLAIEALRDVPVHRGEIRERIDAEQLAAPHWRLVATGNDELMSA